ncbi:conserved hypothetical protein [Ricinus communis]|uniref:Uncharacterized protein n=1 Tax=Ricinus communis TaxID=3988 RepID=B9SJY3_RICCO|nr:conserved hypothetical protein [Ricinus communis]
MKGNHRRRGSASYGGGYKGSGWSSWWHGGGGFCKYGFLWFLRCYYKTWDVRDAYEVAIQTLGLFVKESFDRKRTEGGVLS